MRTGMGLRGATLASLCCLSHAACLVTFEEAPASDGPGLDGIARIDNEPAGDKCPGGGVVVVTGTDADEDGTLDPEEESGVVSVVCAGVAGAAAKVVLLRIAAEPEGGECPNAGQRVESGLDEDADDVLDDDEVESVRFLCNGIGGGVGGQALVVVAEEPPGANCALGGARVRSGVDQDDDAVLDDEEVAATSYVCDGAAGAAGSPGADGADALVDVVAEAPGLACPAGGQRVNAGLDLDDDGALLENEISSTSYVCHGRSLSGGGGGELSGGVAEGSVAAPVALTVGAFTPDASARAATVGAELVSYYRFTTLADPAGDASGPYTIALHDVEADPAVEVYAGSDYVSGAVQVACAFEAARRLVCSTATLAEDTAYYVAIRETRNLALSFALSVSFGARTGTGASPSPAMTGASAHGGGVSWFDVGGAEGDLKTVRLTNIRGVLGASPSLVWDQHNDGAAFAAYGTCATEVGGDVVCPSARLSARTVIGVRETSGNGALFDLVVEDGDTISPPIALDTLTELDAALGVATIGTFTTPNAGLHTLLLDRAAGSFELGGFEIYPDRMSALARVRRLRTCGDDCVLDLPDDVAPGPVYVRAPQRSAGDALPHVLAVSARGGNQGARGEPYALAMEVATGGSLASTSSYQLPATATSTRYSIEVDALYTGNVQCRFYSGADFEQVLYNSLQRNVQQSGCVSEPIAPDTPVYFTLASQLPVVPVAYTLIAHEGDVVTPELAVGGGVHTLEGGGERFLQMPALTPGPYSFVTTTTGNVRRRVFPGHPRNLHYTANLARCESSSATSLNGSPCTRTFVASAAVETHYVEIVLSTHTVTVDVSAVPVHAQLIGTPAVYGAGANESVWIEFDVPADAAYALDVTQSAPGSYLVRLFSPGYIEQRHAAAGSAALATFPLGELSPGRWAVEYDSSGSSALDVTLAVREVP